MPADWKDMLSSLRGQVKEPENEEVTPVEEIQETSSQQKTPIMIITDKKGRNGKIATIIEGFTIPQDEVEKIARELKGKLGVGGSTRPGEILVQGDHIEKIAAFLKQKNFKIRLG